MLPRSSAQGPMVTVIGCRYSPGTRSSHSDTMSRPWRGGAALQWICAHSMSNVTMQPQAAQHALHEPAAAALMA
jgi:hypothetical protein